MVFMGDPGALVLHALLQLTGGLLIAKGDLFTQPQGLDKNKSFGPADIHLALAVSRRHRWPVAQDTPGRHRSRQNNKELGRCGSWNFIWGGPRSVEGGFGPVSLTSTLSKLMGKLIQGQISQYYAEGFML